MALVKGWKVKNSHSAEMPNPQAVGHIRFVHLLFTFKIGHFLARLSRVTYLGDMNKNTRPATGVTTVQSATRPECHAPSGYAINDYSAKPAANGIAPRERMYNMILAFWESQGVARYNRRAGGVWEVRDVLNSVASGEWFPLAAQGEDTRADRAVFSHMRPSSKGGAACACGMVPEVGAFNHSRGDQNAPLTPAARALLMAWPAYWEKHCARPASLARLGK
jgi:hypothetical protein